MVDAHRLIDDAPARRPGGATTPRRRYVPLRGRRRRWLLPDDEITDPRFDYARQLFVGERDGRPWSAPWTPELTYHVASQIPGWCSSTQGVALFDAAARAARRGVIVENGSAWGLSTCWLGWGARSANTDARVYAVDTFQGPPRGDGYLWKTSALPEFTDNMLYAGLKEHVTVVKMLTQDAAERWNTASIAMLYVDGWHSYRACRDDHRAWSRHLLPGATVCFDDCTYNYPGILRYQHELADDSSWTLLGRTDAMLTWIAP